MGATKNGSAKNGTAASNVIAFENGTSAPQKLEASTSSDSTDTETPFANAIEEIKKIKISPTLNKLWATVQEKSKVIGNTLLERKSNPLGRIFITGPFLVLLLPLFFLLLVTVVVVGVVFVLIFLSSTALIFILMLAFFILILLTVLFFSIIR